MIFPLLTLVYVSAVATGGVLKKTGESVTKAYYTKPKTIEGSPQNFSYVQDLDVGEATGQFLRIYKKPYYNRYMARIKKSGMAMAAITDRPAKNVLEDMTKNSTYSDSKIIVTNGGACVYELVDPTQTDTSARYAMTRDLKISEASVEQLKKVLDDVASVGGTKNMPLGAFVVNTTKFSNIYVPEKTSTFARMRISYGLKRRNVVGNNIESDVMADARNISFEIFPKFSSNDFVLKRTSLASVFDKALGIKPPNNLNDPKDPPKTFLDKWLQSRFIPYIGRYDASYQPVNNEGTTPKYKNPPKLRNLIWRHKNTYVDTLNQIDVIRDSLEKLVGTTFLDNNTRQQIAPDYLNDTCVTLSTKGLEFVPKGASKANISELMKNKRSGTQPNRADYSSTAEYNAAMEVWNKQCFINGDNFSDFFVPVLLKDLKDKYDQEKAAAANSNDVDILDIFYRLSQPAQDLSFEDVNEMAIRYNVTGNSLSSIAMDMKGAEAQHITNANNKAQQLMLEESKLDNDFVLGRISGSDYNTKKSEFVKKIDELRTELDKPISTKDYKEVGHNAKNGHEVLERIGERTAP